MRSKTVASTSKNKSSLPTSPSARPYDEGLSIRSKLIEQFSRYTDLADIFPAAVVARPAQTRHRPSRRAKNPIRRNRSAPEPAEPRDRAAADEPPCPADTDPQNDQPSKEFEVNAESAISWKSSNTSPPNSVV